MIVHDAVHNSVWTAAHTNTPNKSKSGHVDFDTACDDQYDSNLDTCACVAHSKRGIGLPLVYGKNVLSWYETKARLKKISSTVTAQHLPPCTESA